MSKLKVIENQNHRVLSNTDNRPTRCEYCKGLLKPEETNVIGTWVICDDCNAELILKYCDGDKT